jgi:hypothetical protein
MTANVPSTLTPSKDFDQGELDVQRLRHAGLLCQLYSHYENFCVVNASAPTFTGFIKYLRDEAEKLTGV